MSLHTGLTVLLCLWLPFQIIMANQRRIRFDSKYKGWRGPVLESCMNKTNDAESVSLDEIIGHF